MTINKKYQVILDNLLDVSPNDTAIFTRINNKYTFDLYKIFGEGLNYIYTQKKFDIPILEVNFINLINSLKDIEHINEFLEKLQENEYEINNATLNLLNKDFAQGKNKIINDLKFNFQKQNLKWKLFLNKAKEINNETNIWSMYLGFTYIKINIEGKSIYAPLFVKEVYIEIRNGRPFLISNGGIQPNEKLMFLLKNAGIDLSLTDDYSDFSIKELSNFIYEQWKEFYECYENINIEFINIDSDQITNKNVEFAPGIVLGLFQPLGGYVRNRMMQILENNELNSILEVEFNKNIYKNKVNSAIFNPKTSIFKITPTNLSQDKAIVSSLNQNTIIWGPPGTGKSQTIVNLLTNLLIYNKSSLVCSQKKAALEVIRNRMKDLSCFCLFMLNSKNMNKKNFYIPIRKYLEFLENFNENTKLEPLRLLNNKDIDFINNIHKISQDIRFNEASKIVTELSQIDMDLSEDLWNKILTLPKNLKYPINWNFNNSKQFTKFWLHENRLRFRILNPKNWKIKNLGSGVFNLFKGKNVNLNTLTTNINQINFKDLEYLKNLISILPDWDKKDVSDIKNLKNFIAQTIIKKTEKFTKEEKTNYIEFAAAVRLGNLEPHKFIKRYSDMIKIFFPILIVTPDADLSSWSKEEFDYAIMDESSQIFLEKGLPVLYLSKIKVLAGDDKQMKPSNWFGTRISDDSIYGKVDSLLDFATSLGVYSILLDKNYRSNYASLMTFSSKYFYESSLDVIDSFHNENIQPIEVYEVNGTWENNKNEIEKNKVIEIAKNSLNFYEKIILLSFNAKQQDAITDEIFKNHPDLEDAINKSKLLLRNIENIQGDEADLILMSIAYDKNTQIHSTYVGRPGGMNALNVAISRAKDKMIVVKSIKSEELIITTDNEDAKMFKNWLKFLEMDERSRQNFLDIEQSTILEKTKEIQLNSELNDQIKSYLLKLINKNPNLSLAINEPIGTIKIDYVIKKNELPILCFIVDEYKYSGDVENYLKYIDLIKFIKSKKYTTYHLDKINWEKYKEEIANLIKSINSIKENKKIYKTIELPLEEKILDEVSESNLEEFAHNINEVKSFDETTKEWENILHN